MRDQDLASIAQALAQARRERRPLASLPPEAARLSEEAALIVQHQVTCRIGEPIGGWKAGLVPGVRFTYGVVYAPEVRHSPALFHLPCRAPSGQTSAFVEGEVAFILARGLPRRTLPYGEEEVADAIGSCCAAIEIGNPRTLDFQVSPLSHKIADSMGNGAIVYGTGTTDWRSVDFASLRTVLSVDGQCVADQTGNGKNSTPLEALVALANAAAPAPSLEAGQVIITGNRTGLNFALPGMTVSVLLPGLGEASVHLA
jgi:2-keto-4-pentenoate hydratase